MTEWQVRLKGEKSDLEYLCTLSSLNWSVTEQEGEYYLKSTRFNSLTDAHDVLGAATNILDFINGVAKLKFENFQAAKVGGITRVEEDGKHTQFIMPSGIPSAVRFGRPTVVISDGAELSQRPGLQGEALWIEIAEKDESVDRAFALYGLDHDWTNLYKLLETIEYDVGGERALMNKLWAQSSKIKLFKQTANSFHAVGREARHGRKYEAPRNPMSLNEAQSFIRNIFHEWLCSKCQ